MHAAFSPDTSGITIYLLSSFARADVPLGGTVVPLRQCRAIETELHRVVGWYIEETRIAILRSGLLVGLCFILPDGERLMVPCSDVGIKAGTVQIGQLLTLEHLRLIHPATKPLIIHQEHTNEH